MKPHHKRKGERAPVVLDVTWEGASGRHYAHTTDLSTSGCFIETSGAATDSELIRLTLLLTTGEFLLLEGEIVRLAYPSGFGVRFVNLPATAEKALSEAIALYHSKGH